MTSTRPNLTLDVALQGGGSHGAFTWGVLDRLLDEEWLRFDGISGTSAGAVNAAALAAGLVAGGRPEAQATLARVWRSVGRFVSWIVEPQVALAAGTPLEPWVDAAQEWRRAWLATLQPLGDWPTDTARWWGAAWLQTVSPYVANPLDLNPLRPILAETIDFEAVRRCRTVHLFVAATQVRSGRLRLFGCSELTPEVVLASGCLPTLFQAVTIDGEPYWDGGYSGNPALLPLVYGTDADDLLVVQLNPVRRDALPRTVPDILDRMNEITFNSTLLTELRSLALLQLAADGPTRAGATPDRDRLLQRGRSMRVHRLDGGEALTDLGAGTMGNSTLSFLEHLHDLGWARADAWLARHRDDLGARGTLDLSAYLQVDL